MMKYLLAFFIFCNWWACKSPNKIPEEIMGIDKMKLIVWDMINAGEFAQLQYGTDTTLFKEKATENFQKVLKIHRVTKDEFYNSYTYYEQHPDKNKILLDSISAYATRKRNELYRTLHR